MSWSIESGVNAKEKAVCVCMCVCVHMHVHHFIHSEHASKNQESISTPPTGTHLGHFYSVCVSLLSRIKGKKYHKEVLKSHKY